MKFFFLLLPLLYTSVKGDISPSFALIWNNTTSSKQIKKNWTDANAFCESLSLDHTKWRLPSIKELQTIIDLNSYDPSVQNKFKNSTKSSLYWSSTESASNPKRAWSVDFYHGTTTYWSKTNLCYIKCVRNK